MTFAVISLLLIIVITFSCCQPGVPLRSIRLPSSAASEMEDADRASNCPGRSTAPAGPAARLARQPSRPMLSHPSRSCLLVALTTLALSAVAADSALPILSTSVLPFDWIDEKTGHRVIRLSPDEGGSSLYFHQRSYTPEGDKIIIHTRGNLATVDLKALGGPDRPRVEVIAPGTRAFATAWRTREAYVHRGDSIAAIHLDTRTERTVVNLPANARGRQVAVNCDESFVVGIGLDPEGKAIPRTPPAGGLGGSLQEQWAAGTAKMIYTINTKTGVFKVIHRENDWTNHLQCSPTDPQQILFCHEGPWHYNNRTWTIRADGGTARPIHERTMNMEIWGHEFFGPDGRTLWYDLQTPQSGVFWLANLDLQTGRRTWYNLQRDEWSVHYNVSPDGTVFAGDGGGPTSVAARTMDRENIQGNGQWIYLFRPVMTKGSSFRDEKPLIDVGYLKSERLVDMSKHDYSKDRGVEPNLTFTPDGKWIIFSGNFHSPRENGRAVTHTYAVEIASSKKT